MNVFSAHSVNIIPLKRASQMLVPARQTRGVSMTGFAKDNGLAGDTDFDEPFGQSLVPGLIWLTGLVSTLYLVVWASYLMFLSVVFSGYLTSSSELQKSRVRMIGLIPLCGVAPISTGHGAQP